MIRFFADIIYLFFFLTLTAPSSGMFSWPSTINFVPAIARQILKDRKIMRCAMDERL